MKILELYNKILEKNKNETIVDFKIYIPKDEHYSVYDIHQDTIKEITEDDIPKQLFNNLEVANYQIMDEKDYSFSIMANDGFADFEEWYDDKNAKVVIMMVERKEYYSIVNCLA